MAQFIHTVHEYIVLVVRYLLIITVIGFMPVPLFSFLGGNHLEEIDHNPLFQYFSNYQITTDMILENVFTNVYLNQKQKNINQWDVDNAVLWADFITYQLIQEDIPVARKVISTTKSPKLQSLKVLHRETTLESPLDNPEIGQILLNLKDKFQFLLPVSSITEEARQWVIITLNSDEKNVKKQLKFLAKKYPNDNFLVLTQTPISLGKKTHQVQLPLFNIKQAKHVLSEAIKISQVQAQILLVQHERSLWSLNEANSGHSQLTLKTLLGEYHLSLNDASKKELQALQSLCEDGKSPVNKKLDLSDYGVVIKSKNYQWENLNAKLNYQLERGILCGKGKWIDVNEQLKQSKNDEKDQQKSDNNESNSTSNEDNQKDSHNEEQGKSQQQTQENKAENKEL